jgi:hypothetical protein
MAAFGDNGIAVDLPSGWDGQVRPVAPAPDADLRAAGRGDQPTRGASVLHAASFALPAERGDYGSGAVELMGGSDVLVCLLEHEPEAAATALFRHEGVPRLDARQFSPQTMQRAIPGMAGTQHFFQVAGRPFCLYVVVGSFATRGPLVRVADGVVQTIRVTG